MKEARSFLGTIEAGRAGAAIGALAYPLAALPAGVILAAAGGRERFARLVLLAALAMTLLMVMAFIRSFTYAAWFAVPVMAVAVADLQRSLKGAAAKAASAVIASPLAITALAVLITQAAAPAANDNRESGQENACAASASYRTLAGLPPDSWSPKSTSRP